ncbi:hypothetical protein W02_02680 [Nitrospira sp. KM1]|uniref:hypothetical protein n=1 Tax=Nitrospira sp. KM1 TaxID=1936990 RepID=UPI0013A717F5|nr:hypothetical protein [Nitrospira sp. KM1]BCA53128.1 hypothetical protein W02_02680 [Nitrospira sp. KM1]
MRYHRMVPRALGVIAILVVAVGFFRSLDVRNAMRPVVSNGVLYLICAVIFAFVVRKRRDWAARLRQNFFLANRILLPPLSDSDNPRFGVFYHDSYALPGPTRKALGWSFLLLFIIPLVVFQTRGVNLCIAPVVGSGSIILLAAASWIPPGTTLVYWSLWHRIPILTILFVYVAVISPYNDNHAIRTLPRNDPPEIKQPLPDHFNSWLDHRLEDSLVRRNADSVPVIFVAAEGGGIRAAYWTASILTRIQRDMPGFGSHVFVISAVSGGSLGAAIFSALLADEGSSTSCTSAADFPGCARDLLKQDYLSATFGTLLYPDLLQRFLLFPIEYWDRGQTLEMSWERQWNRITKNRLNRFEDSFENLWKGPNAPKVPGLILNMTSVEGGNRVLISNLRISQPEDAGRCVDSWTGRVIGVFDDVIDFSETLNTPKCVDHRDDHSHPRTVRLSTAVNNSARFSFISPAGTLHDRLRIVDGGYFENSGMTSLEEVYREVIPIMSQKFTEWRARRAQQRTIVPVVIYIGNDPEYLTLGVHYLGITETHNSAIIPECIRVEIQGRVPDGFSGSNPHCGRSAPGLPNQTLLLATKSVRDRLVEKRHYTFRLDRQDTVVDVIESGLTYLDEVFAPLTTMYKSQQARGRHASLHLQRQTAYEKILPARYLRFQLRASSSNLPLGWVLSDESTQEVDDQLDATFAKCKPTITQTLAQYIETCWPERH